MAPTSEKTLRKFDKQWIIGHKIGFGIAALIIAAGLIATGIWTKHLQHPGMHWLIVIIATIAVIYFVYDFSYRVSGGDLSQLWWQLALVALFYMLLVWGVGASARTSRVEACIPAHVINVGTPDGAQEWIDYYGSCPGFTYIVDQPTKDYILTNHKLPSWLMSREGITSDPLGWLKYYRGNKNSPYDLSTLTKEEENEFLLGSRQLPPRFIK